MLLIRCELAKIHEAGQNRKLANTETTKLVRDEKE